MEVYILIFGALVVAFAVGASGFADAMIASAIWLHLYSPQETVPLIFVTGIFVHSLSLAYLRRGIELRRLAPFVLGGLIGTPFGIWALQVVDPEPLRRGVGVFLVLVAGWRLWRVLVAPVEVVPKIAEESATLRLADAAVGGMGGILGGLAGISGVLPTLWCGVRGWRPDVQRGVYQPYILMMHLSAFGALGLAGAVPENLAQRFVWCIPALIIGLVLGLAVYRRIDQAKFRIMVLALIFGSGLLLCL